MLVHAVGSGVGTAALQLGRAFGCTVVGTARTPEKLERSRELGLDHAVLAPRQLDPAALAADIIAAAGPVDVTLDPVGGDYLVTDLAVAGPRGRVVVIGLIAGPRAQLDLGALMYKRMHLFGTMLRGRSVEEKADATDAFTRDVVPLLAHGEVRPVIARTLSLDGARRGLRPAGRRCGVRHHRARPHLSRAGVSRQPSAVSRSAPTPARCPDRARPATGRPGRVGRSRDR